MSFFIQDLHLKFNSFLGFQHGICLSVKAIMQLSATLPLPIGLKCFWFLIALLLYPKSTILGLSFLYPKDLCLPNQFSRESWQKCSVSTYLAWCQIRNWVASMIQLMIIFNPSYVCHDMKIFWPVSFVKFPWYCCTESSQSWKDFRKTLWSNENLKLLIDLSGANIGIHSNSRKRLVILNVHDVKKSIH